MLFTLERVVLDLVSNMRIIKDTNYDFMSKVGITRILSILVLSIGFNITDYK